MCAGVLLCDPVAAPGPDINCLLEDEPAAGTHSRLQLLFSDSLLAKAAALSLQQAASLFIPGRKMKRMNY